MHSNKNHPKEVTRWCSSQNLQTIAGYVLAAAGEEIPVQPLEDQYESEDISPKYIPCVDESVRFEECYSFAVAQWPCLCTRVHRDKQ